MRNLLDLADSLEQRASKIDKKSSEAAAKVALTIITELVWVNPVDTSKALSNWQIGIGSPVDSRIEPYSPGEGGSTQRASASATIAVAKKILATKKPGQVVYISNALPYIKRLNEGHSGQEPAGFVERAVMLGRKQVAKTRLKV